MRRRVIIVAVRRSAFEAWRGDRYRDARWSGALASGNLRMLAAIPEDPSANDPVAHPQHAKERRNLVIGLLYSQGYLTKSQYENSLVYPMPKPDEVNLPSTQGVAAPYFANYVKDQLVNRLGPGRAFGGGLRVTTTLDVDLQQIARDYYPQVLELLGVTA